MAKELPYFRFTVQDWQNGKISLESYELQGLFISICGYYWINDCHLTLAMLQKKFSNAKDMLKELIDLGILKHQNRHDKIEIEFLNKQYDLLSENRKRRQSAGSKGGNAKAMLKQKGSYKDKDKDKDKERDSSKQRLFKNSIYFDKAKFKEAFPDWSTEKLKHYYESALDWSESKGKLMKDWKATIRGWARKDADEGKEFDKPKPKVSSGMQFGLM